MRKRAIKRAFLFLLFILRPYPGLLPESVHSRKYHTYLSACPALMPGYLIYLLARYALGCYFAAHQRKGSRAYARRRLDKNSAGIFGRRNEVSRPEGKIISR